VSFDRNIYISVVIIILQMLQNNNKWKVLQLFFDKPLAEGGLQLREISREIKLAPTSVKNYLKELVKECFVLEKKNRVQNYPIYLANRDNEIFMFYKKLDILIRLNDSGLVNTIYDKCLPQVIVLFGSAARGEDTENSDIDLYIGAKEVEINLNNYENSLKRKINLFFEPKFTKLSLELKNNILNGVILKGYLEVSKC